MRGRGFGRQGEYVVPPERYIMWARRLLPPGEFERNEVRIRWAAENAAERLASYWPEEEGFGSSDMTFEVQSMLGDAGYKTAFVGGLLKVVGLKQELGRCRCV